MPYAAGHNAMDTGVVGILGAGTMGAGIAQVAATAGWTVRLMDLDASRVQDAIDAIGRRLDRLVEKGRLPASERDAVVRRLVPASKADELADCDLLLEAIVEDPDAKAQALRALVPHLKPACILATNTSSLSVTELGRRIGVGPRLVGLHFFNPAPVMPLVELVAGQETAAEVLDRAGVVARAWGKTVARAADTPGFIVNRVARPYYLEAFRMLEEGLAPAEQIDGAMTRLGGFRMGPLELSDLIGQDVNAATTRSIWDRLGRPARLEPCPLQEALVRAGQLGQKTGRGVYRYRDGKRAGAAVAVAAGGPPPVELQRAAEQMAHVWVTEPAAPVEHVLAARVIAAIVAEARWARHEGVASADDIDAAMTLGVNYPAGPFAWEARIGRARIDALLAALERATGRGRYRPAPGTPPADL